MRLGKAAAVSVLVIATMGIGTGTVCASPEPPSNGASVNYRTAVGPDGRSVETILENGTFRIAETGHTVDVLNGAGTTLLSLPMAYSVRGNAFPISAFIDEAGRRLTLTPDTTNVAGSLPLQDVDARNDAYQNLIRQAQIGWTNGGGMSAGIGTTIGAVVGCILFFFVGCIPGAAIGAAIGAFVGVSNANPAFQPAIFELIAKL